MRTIIISIFLLTVRVASAQPEQDYPVVGEQIPNFKLTNVHYYSQKTFDPQEVKGKWIILDFWSKGCVACVQSFPKVNELQDEFKDDIQFLLIGKNDKYNRNIEQVFEKYRKKLGLNLAIAYDSAIFKQFRIQGVPYVVVIDPEKKVYAITGSQFFTPEKIKALFDKGKPLAISPGSTGRWKHLLSETEIESSNFLYRSVLSPYGGEAMSGSFVIDQYASQGYHQVVRANLFQLYKIAWFGMGYWPGGDFYNSHWQDPVLEIMDSSAFQFNYDTYEGFYNYSLTVPKAKATKAYLMEVMQRDLKNYFGYEVAIETRMMPYWKLTATENARKNLKTKSKIHKGGFEPIGIDGERIMVENILNEIERYNSDEHFPFIDETNIKGLIDISFSAVMTDMEDVSKALKKHGLILEKSKKEFKVLVIRDPKPEDRNN